MTQSTRNTCCGSTATRLSTFIALNATGVATSKRTALPAELLHLLTDSKSGFSLTSGGDNAGIVSELGGRCRRYRFGRRRAGTPSVGLETILDCAPSAFGGRYGSDR
ncbi:hypothetical protein CA601_02840 [Paraburkholderia hospita]|nr:hypothetical protein CA601_02840 [Paraburkholderia hospita]